MSVEAKAALRTEMRLRRDQLPLERRAAFAELIRRSLLEMDQVRAASTILIFYSFGSEVPTRSILRALHDRGARLLLPFLSEAVMEAAEVGPDDELPRSLYGPREPVHRVPVSPEEVDVVVTPGLAFDREGNRLGYGGGHYDRYLTRLRPHAIRIGLAFSIQIVERVPVGAQDQRVHLVATDEGVIDCR